MNATLYKQKPAPRKVGVTGYVASDPKTARFFGADDTLIATLEAPTLKFISVDGMMLHGFEPNGYTVRGIQKLFYQEWLLRFE